MPEDDTYTTRTVILPKVSRDAKEHVTSAVLVPPDVRTITLGIEADAIDWSSLGVNVTLAAEISKDGVEWRRWHSIEVDTRKGIPVERPELAFDVGNLAGWKIRAKLTTNVTMDVGVALETKV